MEGRPVAARLAPDEHCADWYLNDVFDATADELCTIEYICQVVPTPPPSSGGENAAQEGQSIWLVSERNEAILQISPQHPLHTVLILGPIDDDDDDAAEDSTALVFEYSPERVRNLIASVRGDRALEQEAKAWWDQTKNLPPTVRLTRRNCSRID